jgi:CubicO group peptidase (beta-lactamase class C family)
MICENKNMKIMKKVFLLNMIAMFGFLLSYCQQANDSTEQKMFKQKKLSQEEYLEYRREKININNPDVQSKINALDCYFSKRVDSLGFNGAVLVIYRGTPILEGYYGYSNFSNKTKLNKRSSFQIASTTKTFTSGAILMLHQEGYLDIDDTLQKYFPNFPYKGITIRMLLNHRSGLPNYLNFSESYWVNKSSYMSNEDVLNQLQKFKPKTLAAPNTKFYYNNTNYVLLALIIEKTSGYKYHDFMHKFIFHPLGMHDTHVFDPRNQHKNEVKGYKGSAWKEDNLVYTDGVTGDKGIYASVLDLHKWDQALYAGKLIKPEVLNLAFTPQSFEKPGNKNYGLGWRMTDQEDGTRIIYHNGWWHSFNSVFNRKISDGTTIIILSNHYSQSVYKIKEIWDILYNNVDVESDTE